MDLSKLTSKITYIEAIQMLREVYDKMFGLQTGSNGCSQVDEEDPMKNSLFEYWAEQYVRYQIKDRWGLSWNDYIDQPRFKIVKLNQISERFSKAELNPPTN